MRPLVTLALGMILIVVGAASGYAILTGRIGATGPVADLGCMPGQAVERPAPVLVLQDLRGNPADLEVLRGQVVLLNLWASWCPPCRAEMPELQRFYEAHREAGLVVVGINIGETPDVVADFVEARRLTFPVWLDPDEASLRALQMLSLPATIAVDRTGVLRLVWAGPVCNTQLEAQAAPLLAE